MSIQSGIVGEVGVDFQAAGLVGVHFLARATGSLLFGRLSGAQEIGGAGFAFLVGGGFIERGVGGAGRLVDLAAYESVGGFQTLPARGAGRRHSVAATFDYFVLDWGIV